MPIVIREAHIDDSKGIATVNLVTWQKSYRDFFPSDKLDNYSIEENTQAWKDRIQSVNPNVFFYIAEDVDSGIVGFATGGKAGLFDKLGNSDCEIFAIYVLNEYHRRGIGTALVQRLLKIFQSKEWKTMIIWTLKHSIFRAFYEKLGGIPRISKEYEKWGIKLELSGYVWDNISEIPSWI